MQLLHFKMKSSLLVIKKAFQYKTLYIGSPVSYKFKVVNAPMLNLPGLHIRVVLLGGVPHDYFLSDAYVRCEQAVEYVFTIHVKEPSLLFTHHVTIW